MIPLRSKLRRLLLTIPASLSVFSLLALVDNRSYVGYDANGGADGSATESDPGIETLVQPVHCAMPEDLRWAQMLSTGTADNPVNVYSAFVDDRVPPARIRLIAAMDVGEAKRSSYARFTCSMGNENERTPVHLYEMCENHGKRFGSYILSCDHPNRTGNDTTVAIFDAQHNRRIAVPLHARQAVHSSHNATYAVCVHAPLFGTRYTPEYLAQYVELNRMLGVDHFLVYLSDDRGVKQFDHLLRLYAALGVVSTFNWTLGDIGVDKIWYRMQMAAIQDCLYRTTAARIDYVAFHDLDELIVPQNAAVSLKEHAARLWERKPDAAGFTHQPLLLAGSRADAPRLFAAKLGGGYAPPADGHSGAFFRGKVLVRPERIFEMGIHHISKPIADRYTSERCNVNSALLYHFGGTSGVNARGNSTIRVFDDLGSTVMERARAVINYSAA